MNTIMIKYFSLLHFILLVSLKTSRNGELIHILEFFYRNNSNKAGKASVPSQLQTRQICHFESLF